MKTKPQAPAEEKQAPRPMPLVDARVDFEMPDLSDLVPYQPTGPLSQDAFTGLLNVVKLRREVIQRIGNIKQYRGRWKRANAELLDIEAALLRDDLSNHVRLDLQGRRELALGAMWTQEQMCQQEELEIRCLLLGFQHQEALTPPPTEGKSDGV